MSLGDASIEDPSLTARVRRSAAEDLQFLAFLHGQELDGQLIEGLRRSGFQRQLGLVVRSPLGKEALGIIARALDELPEELADETIDSLAMEYANIYLTYLYRSSPCESAWFDEYGLERQESMFEVRAWYRRYGLVARDQRKRPDDHLVFQLQFLSQLLLRDDSDSALRDSAQFMDEHLLRWLGQFAGRTASRCQEALYAGLALLTAAYAEELRDLLAVMLAEPRPAPEEIERRKTPQFDAPQDTGQAFNPGSGPGW